MGDAHGAGQAGAGPTGGSGSPASPVRPPAPRVHPVKRRTADRRDWALITRRRFAVARVDEAAFAGHVGLLMIDAVTAPFVGSRSGVCFADAGFAWLTHLPDGTRHTITTMFDAAGRVIQWYVDVCRSHGLGSDGVPWWDDLYLDVVVRPSGEMLLLDDDELELALAHGYVTQAEYDLAWREARRLLTAGGGYLSPARLAVPSGAHRDLLHRLVEGTGVGTSDLPSEGVPGVDAGHDRSAGRASGSPGTRESGNQASEA